MKNKLLFLAFSLLCFSAVGQTFTMGNKCYDQNKAGIDLLKQKKYQAALDGFTAMEKSCNTKDAKEARACGKAEALNGLGRYTEAITASEEAIKVSKNTSLMGYFQKATAQAKLKQFDAAKATFSNVLRLTEKNQDTKARASNYAVMALLMWRQIGKIDSANYYLEKAIALDPSNPNFIVQKGDMLVEQKKYDAAFVQYDKAVAMGKTDLEMYSIRSNARMKMVQEKYKTTNAQELRSKMSASEKTQLCTELQKALSLGWKDMKQDMFAALVCK